MGGGGGGHFLPERSTKELESLVSQLCQEDKKTKNGDNKSNKHVFISFAQEDLKEVNLLRGQAKNKDSFLEFDDYSLRKAFNSKKEDYIRQGIKNRMQQVSVLVVYLTKNSAKSGWVNWEIQEAIRQKKGVIGVYKEGQKPKSFPPSFKKNKLKIVKWNQKDLTKAIKEASNSSKKDKGKK